ncbi:hypothetical protein [Anaerosporobacter sp.]
MNYKDYKMSKKGQYESVGTFGDSIYAYEYLTGACCVPEYIQITKAEYDTFEQWKNECIGDFGKNLKYIIVKLCVVRIRNR